MLSTRLAVGSKNALRAAAFDCKKNLAAVRSVPQFHVRQTTVIIAAARTVLALLRDTAAARAFDRSLIPSLPHASIAAGELLALKIDGRVVIPARWQ